MHTNASDLVRAFFFGDAEVPATDGVHVDVLDSWTNRGLTAVRPTTISWSESRRDDGR